MLTINYIELLEQGKIPPQPPATCSIGGYDYNSSDYRLRNRATKHTWPVLDQIWIAALASWIDSRTVLEIMGGSGLLAKALLHQGVNITCTDALSKDYQCTTSPLPIVHHMEAATAIQLYSKKDILLVSWPPYDCSAILDACELWGATRPIIYIGENGGGCNAPEEFFSKFKMLNEIKHPQIPLTCWSGIHDSVMIGYYS